MQNPLSKFILAIKALSSADQFPKYLQVLLGQTKIEDSDMKIILLSASILCQKNIRQGFKQLNECLGTFAFWCER